MSTPWTRHLGALAVVAVLAAGCGGQEERPQADPTPSAPPLESASSTPTASATPTATPQPRSSTSVTYDIVNWDDFADEPSLVAYKRVNEAFSASVNQDKVLPQLRQASTPSFFRFGLQQYGYSQDGDWRLPKVATVHVQSIRTRGTTSNLRLCLWSPSTSTTFKDGSPVDGVPVKKEWVRSNATAQKSKGTWRISKLSFPGDLPGSSATLTSVKC